MLNQVIAQGLRFISTLDELSRCVDESTYMLNQAIAQGRTSLSNSEQLTGGASGGASMVNQAGKSFSYSDGRLSASSDRTQVCILRQYGFLNMSLQLLHSLQPRQ